jgi:5-methylcytosine-specific restriction endonuclease McrA
MTAYAAPVALPLDHVVPGRSPDRPGRWRRIRNRGGSAARRAMAHRLAEAQNWRCAYCHCALDFATVTIEHVQPLGDGGAHDWGNMVAACEPCNAARNGSSRRAARPAAAAIARLGDFWPQQGAIA